VYLGKKHVRRAIGKRPRAADWWKLARIAKQGISPQTVERCNAAPTDDPDDLPAAWS
jgi:hypothetical protein